VGNTESTLDVVSAACAFNAGARSRNTARKKATRDNNQPVRFMQRLLKKWIKSRVDRD
jgi:hypothetical protein